MKIILSTLLLTCFGLCAQTPPAATAGANDASDQVLRRALRDALATADAQAAPDATAATPTVPASAGAAANIQLAQAGPPAFPTPPAFKRFQRPVPPLNGATNPVTGAAVTNNPLLGLVGTNGASGAAAGQPLNSATAIPPRFPQFPGVSGALAKSEEEIIPPGQLDFPDISIDQVLDVYAMLVQRTVLRPTLPPIKITLKTQTPLTRTEAVQALTSVLAMNQITMINVGDKFVKAVPVNIASAQGAVFNSRDYVKLPEDDEYITQIVQLKYVKPKDIVPVLTPLANIPNSILPIDDNQMLVIRDYSPNIKRMMELIKQIDVTVPLDFESEVIPIKYAQATDIASALSSLGSGTGTSIGKGSNVGGGGASRSGTMGTTGGYGGAGGFGSTPGTTGTLGTTGAGSTPFGSSAAAGGNRTSSFQDRLSNLVKKAGAQGDFQVLGQTKIIADQRTNSLLVFAGKQDMEMIKKIISELDIVLAQVLIEAVIMEVSLDKGHNVGVSYVQTNPSQIGNYFQGLAGANNGAFLNSSSFAGSSGTDLASSLPAGFSYLATFGNDFQATLTAVATDSRITVLSRPRIQTSHGVMANIQVGDQIPMVTGTYFGGINGAASSQYQLQFVGIQLQVTPLINPDGLVVMDINEQVQNLGNTYSIDGNQVPSTTQRAAQATVSVRDRDTIILGGMISTTKNTTHSGVPFLKDIPGLGYLFRNTSVDNQRTELIVLIHPTVLPTPESAALVATHERNRLPLVKRAEAEELEDANRRLKDSEKVKVPEEQQ